MMLRWSVAICLILLALYGYPAVARDNLYFDDQRSSEWNRPEVCSGIPDIEKKLGPNRDQGQRGWCYAEPGADLVTAATGIYTSSADIAIHHNRDFYKDKKGFCAKSRFLEDGGFTGDALLATEPSGFCSESDFPSKHFMDLGAEQFAHRVNQLETAVGSKICPGQALEALKTLFPQQTREQLINLAQALKQSSERSFLSDLAERKCASRRYPLFNVPVAKYLHGANTMEMKASILAAIKQMRSGQPVEMGMDIAPFLKPSGLSAFIDEIKKNPIAELCQAADDIKEGQLLSRSALHAMTAVGLKYDYASRKCYVRLRNSWGGDCKPFVQGVCRKNGDLEIPIDVLQKQIIDMTYLKTTDL